MLTSKNGPITVSREEREWSLTGANGTADSFAGDVWATLETLAAYNPHEVKQYAVRVLSRTNDVRIDVNASWANILCMAVMTGHQVAVVFPLEIAWAGVAGWDDNLSGFPWGKAHGARNVVIVNVSVEDGIAALILGAVDVGASISARSTGIAQVLGGVWQAHVASCIPTLRVMAAANDSRVDKLGTSPAGLLSPACVRDTSTPTTASSSDGEDNLFSRC